MHALGINLGRARMAVFGLGAALAGMAGVVAAPMWGLKPSVGTEAVMPALIVVVIGGIGSFWGSVIGGALLRDPRRPVHLLVPPRRLLPVYLLMTSLVAC